MGGYFNLVQNTIRWNVTPHLTELLSQPSFSILWAASFANLLTVRTERILRSFEGEILLHQLMDGKWIDPNHSFSALQRPGIVCLQLNTLDLCISRHKKTLLNMTSPIVQRQQRGAKMAELLTRSHHGSLWHHLDLSTPMVWRCHQHSFCNRYFLVW
jgi:hypothetical protein